MENKIFEKKVFFLFQPMGILDDVMRSAIENEYEAYVIHDPALCLALLKRFHHSVLFVNIDAGMLEGEWAVWIQRLLLSPETNTTQVGVFSSRNDDDLREKYLIDIGIQCGYIHMRAGISAMQKTVLAVLEAVEAHGRRKYIRVSCADLANCKLNIKRSDDRIIVGKIFDVSVVGFSCVFEMDMFFEKNEVIRNVQMILSGIIVLTDVVFFASRADNGRTIYVMLFSPTSVRVIASKIRMFVNKTLQLRMDKVIQEILVTERKKLREGSETKGEDMLYLEPANDEDISKNSADENLDIEDFGMLEPIDIE